MRYVSFDIECADVYQNYTDMCAFGYAIADEDFNIVSVEEIVIKPKRVGKYISKKFGWTMDDFKDAPRFIEVYPKIKALLEHPDQLIFAHSAISDLKYLGKECRKNRLVSPEIEVYNTEAIFKRYTGSDKPSLENTKEWSGAEFENHNAADDAKGCLYIPKKMFEIEGEEKFDKLMDVFKDTIVSTEDADKALDLEERRAYLNRMFSEKWQVTPTSKEMEGITLSLSKDIMRKEMDTLEKVGTLVLSSSGKLVKDIDDADIHISLGAVYDGLRIYVTKSGREVVRMNDKEIINAVKNRKVRSEMERYRKMWKDATQ
jgi:DNA polymerase III epsilon subunit-like protein